METLHCHRHVWEDPANRDSSFQGMRASVPDTRFMQLDRESFGAESVYLMELVRLDISVRVKVVRRKRKTMALYVERDTPAELRVPVNCPWQDIHDFLDSKFDWILSAEKELAERNLRPPDRFEAGGQVSYLGQRLHLEVARSRYQFVDRQSDSLLVSCSRPRNPELIQRHVLDWYRRQGEQLFAQRMHELNRTFSDGIEPKGLVIRKMKSRWGSCSSRGEICLNLLLVKECLPQIDFVITHELCHLRQFAHNAAFYRLMDNVMPDWKDREAMLGRNS